MAIGGGAGLIGVVLFILLQLLGGGDVTSGALPGIDQIQGEQSNLAEECKTGADANAKDDCRVVAVVNSLQEYWAAEFQRSGGQYQKAPTRLFSGGVQTGCGAASSEVGPFYCPRDGTVYIDLGFYDDLRTKFGAQGGPFAQAYVLAHEYGHHVQNLTGTMEQVGGSRHRPPERRRPPRAPGRLLRRPVGQPRHHRARPRRRRPPGRAHHRAGHRRRPRRRRRHRRRPHPGELPGPVNPETWTHGSAAQRQKWFEVGYRTGDPAQCNTFRGSV